jgi:hypothetical protein
MSRMKSRKQADWDHPPRRGLGYTIV